MAFLAPQHLPVFNYRSFDVISNAKCDNCLLPNQLEALNRLVGWFRPDSDNKEQIAVVSMPTGSGKTGVMACLPYFLGSIGLHQGNPPNGEPFYRFDKPSVLVVAPTPEIAGQLERQFSPAYSNEMFLVRTNIIPLEAMSTAHVTPDVRNLDSTKQVSNQRFLQTYDIIISNYHKFISPQWEDEWKEDQFCLVMIDEAHHHPAPTWKRIVDKCRGGRAKVVFFTATPYRSDKKKIVEGMPQLIKLAYHFKRADAVQAGIIRHLEFEQTEQYHDSNNIILRDPARYTDNDKEEMTRMVPVLQRVEELLREKNAQRPFPGNVQHTAMAITKSVNQADLLLELWKILYTDQAAETYYSERREKEQIMHKLKNNELRLIIVVEMLKEGFDYPPISIVAITTKIDSLVKFTQFVGRAQRICRGPDGTEENALAHIITHVNYEQQNNFRHLIDETFIPSE